MKYFRKTKFFNTATITIFIYSSINPTSIADAEAAYALIV